jgi:hypothetical protein
MRKLQSTCLLLSLLTISLTLASALKFDENNNLNVTLSKNAATDKGGKGKLYVFCQKMLILCVKMFI